MNHNLISAGAPFDVDRTPLFEAAKRPFIVGIGCAMCSCGWLGPVRETGSARKADHKAHLEGLADCDNCGTMADLSYDDASGQALCPNCVPLCDACGATAELSYDGTANQYLCVACATPANETFVVPFSGAARLFFKAMAKDAVNTIAPTWGAEISTNETKGEVYVTRGSLAGWNGYEGPEELALLLPTFWDRCNVALRDWRKTSPAYKAHDLKTNPGRVDAFNAEKRYIDAFARAVRDARNSTLVTVSETDPQPTAAGYVAGARAL